MSETPVIFDVPAALRAIPLGKKSSAQQLNLTESNLWLVHLSSTINPNQSTNNQENAPEVSSTSEIIASLESPLQRDELSRMWRSLSFEARNDIWKSYNKPDLFTEYVKFSTWWDIRNGSMQGLYYRQEDIDISTNVDTITRIEKWLSADGLTIKTKETTWYSTSACTIS